MIACTTSSSKGGASGVRLGAPGLAGSAIGLDDAASGGASVPQLVRISCRMCFTSHAMWRRLAFFTISAAATACRHCHRHCQIKSGLFCRRYGSHTADWAPTLGLYAYAAQNSVAVLNTRAKAVRTLLAGHTNRWGRGAFTRQSLQSTNTYAIWRIGMLPKFPRPAPMLQVLRPLPPSTLQGDLCGVCGRRRLGSRTGH